MNLFAEFEAHTQAAAEALRKSAVLPSESRTNLTVEPPRDPSHGDVAINAAMVLAKEAKLPPAIWPSISPTISAPSRTSQRLRSQVPASSI